MRLDAELESMTFVMRLTGRRRPGCLRIRPVPVAIEQSKSGTENGACTSGTVNLCPLMPSQTVNNKSGNGRADIASLAVNLAAGPQDTKVAKTCQCTSPLRRRHLELHREAYRRR